jgi:hypothetical protein
MNNNDDDINMDLANIGPLYEEEEEDSILYYLYKLLIYRPILETNIFGTS